MPDAPPRSAYIHIPFCRRRCGYCNFSVIAGRSDLASPLLDALEIELGWSGEPAEVDTLYVGGGTPTQLRPAEMRRLCLLLRRKRPLAPGGEWTFEANPEDVDPAVVDLLVEQGVTRVSLGVQSFQAPKLQALERCHTGDEAQRAIELFQQDGLQVAVDLIFAAPQEELTTWRGDVDDVARLRPDHVSTYGLTIEHGTAFWGRRRRRALAEVDEQLQREMYIAGIDALEQAGYEHYEVSNFALPGRRSRHNQVYWAGAEYFAEGPGAARYVNGVREVNHRSTTTYLKRVLAGASPVAEREALDDEQRAREMLVLGLRTLNGVDRETFGQRAGRSVDELIAQPLRKFVDLGLLCDDGQTVRLTQDGLLVSDSLWPELL